jgi:signal transduction histidine kinase
MSFSLATPVSPPPRPSVWRAYAGLCVLGWALYAVAGTDWQRGSSQIWTALYEATWNLGPPALLGLAAYPWNLWLHARGLGAAARLAGHVGAALLFVLVCHGLDFALALGFYGMDHASATLEQNLVWRSAWAVFLYVALWLGFSGVIEARRAQDALLAATQAEAALVRAELAAISGKLNPHFLFNTLNTISFLVRKDARAAEHALHGFSTMMRYLLDSQRGAADRVTLDDELGFVRVYLELEALRLGARLKVEWAVDEATRAWMIPPLTLQPLVENSIVHGIAPQPQGGTVRIESRTQSAPAGLLLRVADNGPGCVWPPPRAGTQGGVGLAALQRRFEVDYAGRARLQVQAAPGVGFQVEVFIPELM